MAFVIPAAAIFVVFLTSIVCVKDVSCRKSDTGRQFSLSMKFYRDLEDKDRKIRIHSRNNS